MSRQVRAKNPLSRVARRKVTTNRRLLGLARQLFSEKGIYWATVEDITEAADLGKGTFYKYFESKEAIIRVLLEEGLGELLLKTQQSVRETVPASKIVSSVVNTRVDFFLAYPDYLLFLHQVRGLMQLQLKAGKGLAHIYDDHLRCLAELLEPALSPGAGASARDVATAIAAYTSGLLTYHMLFDGLEAVKRRRDFFVRALECSLEPLMLPSEHMPVSLSGKTIQGTGA